MKKYFVTSDVHSFHTILKNALSEKGFEENNPNHYFILCGDLFDRGKESAALYNFVKNLGDRFIYIRGNHEDLLNDCVYEMETGLTVKSHHHSNGTVDTVNQFLYNEYGTDFNILKYKAFEPYIKNDDKAELNKYFKPINELLNWVNSKSINYFELGDFIFVHGWIPKKPALEEQLYYYYGIGGNGGIYDPDWRTATDFSWEEARWLNGMSEFFKFGIKELNKTIVCGHWRCSYYWSHIKQMYKEFPPKSKKGWENSFKPCIEGGICAIDACTAYSNLMNILVFEEVGENSIKLLQN